MNSRRAIALPLECASEEARSFDPAEWTTYQLAFVDSQERPV